MKEAPGFADSLPQVVLLNRIAWAARIRLEDSEALAENQRFSGAIYLAGYAIEAALEYAVLRSAGFANHDPVDLPAVKAQLREAQRLRLMDKQPHHLVGWAAYLRFRREQSATLPKPEAERLRRTEKLTAEAWRHWRPEIRYLPAAATTQQWKAMRRSAKWIVENVDRL